MNKILIFAKSPLSGKVKTRIEKGTSLNKQDILILYTAFLQDTISSALLSKARRICIAYYPESSRDVMEDIVKKTGCIDELLSGRISLIPQRGSDFDNRLTCAFNEVRLDRDSLIIIGSDAPTLSPTTINRAFNFLKKNSMVLGPSGEGGVYLIGLKIKGKFIFDGLFNNGMEIENLVNSARNKKLPLYVMEELTDVDIQSDMQTLIGNLIALNYSSGFRKELFLPAYTIKVIKKLCLTVVRHGDDTRKKILTKRNTG